MRVISDRDDKIVTSGGIGSQFLQNKRDENKKEKFRVSKDWVRIDSGEAKKRNETSAT